ncbi:type IV toxin-antitoxin system AbiEi family antitoxin domain-containing protein [Nocardioides sp. CPCC 205120]|uniref:type IV toxin-antitoxin system AbiEi family antitoxin domain-containing protein n=1 Tax=Nocardioides sp. CPCC 205120 TaxID=3406462 RepID=UPI003B5005BD
MRDALHDLCARQGYFLTRDALAAGYTETAFYRAVRRGDVERLRHGTFSLPETWAGLDADARHRVLIDAVLARSLVEPVVTHTSAVLLHTAGWWDLDLSSVHVTHPHRRSERRESGVVHHQSRVPEQHLAVVGGVPTVTAARAAIELTTVADTERSLVVMDSLLRERKVTPDELQDMADHARAWPGTLGTRMAVNLADGASGSVGESRSRFQFWRGGIPAPVLQHRVMDGKRLVAVLDFWWPEHGLAGEFDGMAKYGRLVPEGMTPADVLAAEKQREDEVRELLGCRFIRYTWQDLDRRARMIDRTRSMLGLA